MTTMSWCLECTTGILALVLMHGSFTDELAISAFFLADVCLNFIVIPSSYIFNNEATKQDIISDGWYKWFNNFFRSNTVVPATNENPEAPIALKPVPRPISTISGNINALSTGK